LGEGTVSANCIAEFQQCLPLISRPEKRWRESEADDGSENADSSGLSGLQDGTNHDREMAWLLERRKSRPALDDDDEKSGRQQETPDER